MMNIESAEQAYKIAFDRGYRGDDPEAYDVPEKFLIPFYNGYEAGTDAWLAEDEEEGEQSRVPEDDDGLTDAEADAMTLASAGMGTDEDYGYFGESDFDY